MKIEHEIPQPWREHLQLLLRQNAADEQQALMLRGQAALLDQQRAENSRAAANILTLLVKEAALPTPTKPYTLSPDGAKIIGEVPDPKPPQE